MTSCCEGEHNIGSMKAPSKAEDNQWYFSEVTNWRTPIIYHESALVAVLSQVLWFCILCIYLYICKDVFRLRAGGRVGPHLVLGFCGNQ